jgi:hypothetical protein
MSWIPGPPSFWYLRVGGMLSARQIIFLMNAPQTGGCADSIVAFDDDGDFVLKMHDSGIYNRKPERPPQLQTEMFVLGVAVEVAGWRLENVSGWNAAGRHGPCAVLEEKSGFRLRPGKAELAGITRNAPRGVVLAQRPQALCNGGFIEPFDFRGEPHPGQPEAARAGRTEPPRRNPRRRRR